LEQQAADCEPGDVAVEPPQLRGCQAGWIVGFRTVLHSLLFEAWRGDLVSLPR
jgi:hypothetical protein